MAAPVAPLPDGLRLGFVGAGKMAESIVRGVATSGVLPPSSICTAHRSADRRDVFRSFGVKILETNAQVVEDSDVIVLSVKPQIAKNVLLELNPFFSEGKILVSIAAGIKLKHLQEWSGHSRLIRVMPNTPSTVGQGASGYFLNPRLMYNANAHVDAEVLQGTLRVIGRLSRTQDKRLQAEVEMTSYRMKSETYSDSQLQYAVGRVSPVMCLGERATRTDGEWVASLFSAIGKIWTTDEKYFDAVTGLSGSGPAYIYLAIEALADGGVAAGLPRDLALSLASQTVLGAAAMVNSTGKHPGQLKDDVGSPGGTTIAGIHELEKGGFRGILMNAVVAATNRCRELSK